MKYISQLHFGVAQFAVSIDNRGVLIRKLLCGSFYESTTFVIGRVQTDFAEQCQ